MPSTSQQRRARTTTRRSPRPAPHPAFAPVAPERPLLVPFAVLFAGLVAAVYGYLAWLLDFGWYLAVPVVLGLAALAGAALVWRGVRLGWVPLAVVASLLLLGLLGLTALFGLLGAGRATWSAAAMLIAPVGCLALVLRRPVRRWCAATRSTAGRRAERSGR